MGLTDIACLEGQVSFQYTWVEYDLGWNSKFTFSSGGI